MLIIQIIQYNTKVLYRNEISFSKMYYPYSLLYIFNTYSLSRLVSRFLPGETLVSCPWNFCSMLVKLLFHADGTFIPCRWNDHFLPLELFFLYTKLEFYRPIVTISGLHLLKKRTNVESFYCTFPVYTFFYTKKLLILYFCIRDISRLWPIENIFVRIAT